MPFEKCIYWVQGGHHTEISDSDHQPCTYIKSLAYMIDCSSRRPITTLLTVVGSNRSNKCSNSTPESHLAASSSPRYPHSRSIPICRKLLTLLLARTQSIRLIHNSSFSIELIFSLIQNSIPTISSSFSLLWYKWTVLDRACLHDLFGRPAD